MKSSVRKVSVLLRHLKMSKTSLNGKVTARSSSPMLFFFLCCLFQQNDKSSSFHDGLSAVWLLDPGRILGRDGSHVWPESHDVTVCRTKIQVKRCRGTCRSISRIAMGFPYYKKYCQCCQGNKFTDKTVSCAGGDHKKIRLPAGSSCEDCLA